MKIAPIPLLLLVITMGASAQSIETSLGGSELSGLAGVQTNFQYANSFGWTGIGYYNGFQLTGYLNTPLRRQYRVGFGDQAFDAGFATDEYSLYRVAMRGASLIRHTANSDTVAFIGRFSSDDQQPYFHSIYQINPDLMGMIAGHVDVSKTFKLQTYNTYGSSISSVQSLAWKPSPPWHISSAAGMGNSHPYFANAAQYRKGSLDLRVCYTVADDHFHRQDGTYEMEPLGLNAKALIPVGDNMVLRYSHRHELLTIPKHLHFTQDSSIGTIDTAGLATSFFGFRASATVNESSSNTYAGKNFAGVASLSRQIIPRWMSTFSYLHNVMRQQDIQVYQDMNEYRLNPHFTVSHTFDWMNGSISNTFGGKVSFNAFSLSLDNQIYTSPVAAQFGQKSVFQAWNFSLRIRTPHSTQTHLETVVDPFGKTQWGGYLSGLQYHGIAGAAASSDSHVSFSKYIIRGMVVDESGKGVWGIALKIGSELVLSGTDGSFFVHVKNEKPIPVAVVPESSLRSARWSLLRAPASAQGSADESASITVAVRTSFSGGGTKEVAGGSGSGSSGSSMR